MKIGILTFYYAYNYGAMLQAYALKNYLIKCGYDARMIGHKNSSVEQAYPSSSWKTVHRKWFFRIRKWNELSDDLKRAEASSKQWKVRVEKFKSFMQRAFPEDDTTGGNESDLSDYDIILFGSDQIWEKTLTGGYDPVYMGKIETTAVKASYGASCYASGGAFDYGFLDALQKFDFLSVRERELADKLMACFNKEVCCVCDPVFLLQKEDYEKLVKKPEYKGYVLVYYVTDNLLLRALAEIIKKEKDKEVIEIGSTRRDKRDTVRIDFGPEEFLSYLSQADVVLTNSFHGTAFSVIFQKQFISVDGGMRIDNLLDRIRLKERKAKTLQEACELLERKIVYENISSEIALYVQGSEKYLQMVVDKASRSK